MSSVDKEVDKEGSSTNRACITRLIAVESFLKQGCQGGGFPRSAFRDEREEPGKTNCGYEKEMYSEPGHVNTLGNHLINGRDGPLGSPFLSTHLAVASISSSY